MPFKLHPYQKDGANAVLTAFNNKRRSGLVVLPTGSGKTVLGAVLADQLLSYQLERSDGGKVFWLVHREELKEQALQSFKHQWLRVTVWDSNTKDCTGAVVIVMKDSVRGLREELTRQDEDWFCKCLMIDEAHHEAAATYKDIEEWLQPTYKLGFTATPTRLDNEPLGFDEIFYQLSFVDVVNLGYLARPRYIRFKTHIMARLRSGRGDFTRASMRDALDTDERNELIVNEYIEHQHKYGKTLVFAIDVDHGYELMAMFNTQGVSAAFVEGKMTLEHRNEVIQNFRDGKLDVLINVEIAIEGFDVKDIKTIFLCRPTQSEVYYMQMIGRGARRQDGVSVEKDFFYIVDFIDGSNHYARVADRWAQQHFEAEPDEEIQEQITVEEDVSAFREFLEENGMSPRRKEIHREVYEIDGILKCTNKSGNTKRYVLDSQERAVVEQYIVWVQDLASRGRVTSYDRILDNYHRTHRVGRHFHRRTWMVIAWAIFWRYIKGVEVRNEQPVLQYVPFQIGATHGDDTA